MANPNLITVAQMKAELRRALELLDAMDEAKPVNIAAYGGAVDHTAGFVTAFSITAEPSMDEEEADVNVDFNWTEA